MGWDRNIGLNQYGDTWRVHRKICQQNFNQRAAVGYQPLIKSQVQVLLQGLLTSPDRLDEHTKKCVVHSCLLCSIDDADRYTNRFSTAIPLSAMYGYEVTSLEDPLVTIADKSLLMGTTLLTPGGSLINIFPFLRHVPAWFPGASSRKTADEVKRMTEWLIQNPLDWVKDKMVGYDPRR